jgi:hypothetical protein
MAALQAAQHKMNYIVRSKIPGWGSYSEIVEAANEQEAETIFRSGLSKYGDLSVIVEPLERYEDRIRAAQEYYEKAAPEEE